MIGFIHAASKGVYETKLTGVTMGPRSDSEQSDSRVFQILWLVGRGLLVGIFGVIPAVLLVALMVGLPIAYVLATVIPVGDSTEALAEKLAWPVVTITGIIFCAYLFFEHTEVGRYWWSRVPLPVQESDDSAAPVDIDDHDYPDDWDERRRKVYRRDKYRCRNCGASDVELHAHHIVPLRAGGTDKKSNLVTLCRGCHERIHAHMG